jgi:hypothetical protein
MPATDVDASLSRLKAVAAGLVYSSEGDHPFEIVHLVRADTGPLSLDGIRELLSLPADSPVALVSLERALGRHTVLTDPLDLEAQAIRPRYEAMVRLFEDELADSLAIRTGRAPLVDLWILGRAPGGELVGYHTVAVET